MQARIGPLRMRNNPAKYVVSCRTFCIERSFAAVVSRRLFAAAAEFICCGT